MIHTIIQRRSIGHRLLVGVAVLAGGLTMGCGTRHVSNTAIAPTYIAPLSAIDTPAVITSNDRLFMEPIRDGHTLRTVVGVDVK